MPKSVMVAYALWALGGPLGLHHIYLQRDSHALLWMVTLGGFGLGWVREFIRIPSYVAEANQDTERLKKHYQHHPLALPPAGPVRFTGQVCVGIYFGTMALLGLNTFSFFYLLVLPLSVGAGVHLVSTVGQQTSDFKKTLTTCLITSPIFYGSTLSLVPISVAASVTASKNRKYKPIQPKQDLVPRLYYLGLAWLAFSAPVGYGIFHNTTATLYFLSDCLSALLDVFWFVPWLRNVLEYVLLMPYRILCALTGGGYYDEVWRRVLEILLKEYTEKEREALKILSLKGEATLEEISRSYRELAKTWHPDHNPNKEAEAMFVKIHEAYQLLLRRHKPHRFR
ncbi:dnaJ homolog subfamily C member 22 [Boleophthalmus pectinirostris]|uniref:dnaJ homolog subfamily C member 22 n=1 Tax=Boleophthalmus pectinirostris TaxID=150288 RepID=UPI000A1C5B1E|nr:dnaJ homolog subfamily C member 22 [Boleophthalmus pectinirostris]XP_020785257.1 dnaJ homolog subfamily C member 22 [Boleophthalmus pectinirostris]